VIQRADHYPGSWFLENNASAITLYITTDTWQVTEEEQVMPKFREIFPGNLLAGKQPCNGIPMLPLGFSLVYLIATNIKN
jgi:hypothetical protein